MLLNFKIIIKSKKINKKELFLLIFLFLTLYNYLRSESSEQDLYELSLTELSQIKVSSVSKSNNYLSKSSKRFY